MSSILMLCKENVKIFKMAKFRTKRMHQQEPHRPDR